jgi:hypothetical protein
MTENYYTILGVDSNANPDQIKSAYRKKAKKLHPDRYGQNSEPFRAVQEAYDVLSDPERRRAYDDRLARDRHVQNASPAVRAEPLWPRRRPVEPLIPIQEDIYLRGIVDWPFQAFHSPLVEILDRIWSSFEGLAWPPFQGVKSLAVEISLTPNQALRGGRARIVISVQTECPACWGYGSTGFTACRRCSGTGTVTQEHPLIVTFPPGISDGDTASLPLDQLGIYDVDLTVHFRVS